MTPVRLMVLIGLAPGILTETTWWARRQGWDVRGVEVWTTSKGARQLETQGKGMWAALRGVHPDLPALPQRFDLAPEECRRASFEVAVFRDAAGTPLPDIRTPQDAEAVATQLYERVRWLRQNLQEEIALVGSVAGGRKTMGASLQSAFEMHARPQDRLVHVLVHPAIEETRVGGKPLVVDYSFPGDGTVEQHLPDLRIEDHLDVYPVRFPRLRSLLGREALKETSMITSVLDSQPFVALWPLLEARAVQARAQLRRTRNAWKAATWLLQITTADGRAHDIPLTNKLALVYAALARAGAAGLGQEAIDEAIVALDSEADLAEYGAVRARMTALREKLAALPGLRLGEFVPTKHSRPTRIPAWDRIEVLL